MSQPIDEGWDVERDGRMVDYADYHLIVTLPGSHPRPPVDPATDPVTDCPPIIVEGEL